MLICVPCHMSLHLIVMFAAATASDASVAANSETAVADCQVAVDGLCIDNEGGMLLISHVI